MRALILLVFFCCSITIRAQYFNTRYILGFYETLFNNIYNDDSSLYVGGLYASIYASKLCFAKFDFEGNEKGLQFFEVDSHTAYQINTHSYSKIGNEISFCGSLSISSQTSSAYAGSIDTSGLSGQKYIDTNTINFFLQSYVILPSANKIYLGAYQTLQYSASFFIIKTDSGGNEIWRKYYPIIPLRQEPSVIIALKMATSLLGRKEENTHQAQLM